MGESFNFSANQNDRAKEVSIGVYRAIDIGIIYHLLGDKTAVKIFRLQNIIIWIVIGKSLDHPSKKFHHFIFSNFTIHLLKINKIQRKY